MCFLPFPEPTRPRLANRAKRAGGNGILIKFSVFYLLFIFCFFFVDFCFFSFKIEVRSINLSLFAKSKATATENDDEQEQNGKKLRIRKISTINLIWYRNILRIHISASRVFPTQITV